MPIKSDWYPKATLVPGSMNVKGKYARGYPSGAVIHFTAGRDGAIDAIDWGKKQGFVFLCIQKDGRVFQGHPVSQWGWHCGESAWSKAAKKLVGHCNDDLIGIEITAAGRCQKMPDGRFKTWFGTYLTADQVRYSAGTANQQEGYYEKYTEAQEAALIELLLWLKGQAPDVFDFDFVLGHDEVSGPSGIGYWRKNDPGAALSMTMPAFREMLKAKWNNSQGEK